MNAEEQKAAYDRLRAAAAELPDLIAVYLDSLGPDQAATPESPAMDDVKAHGDREAGLTIKGQAWLLIRTAIDNLWGVIRLTTEPTLVISPFSCARNVLDTCSHALWLLDPQIESLERLSRSMSLRLNGLDDQVRILLGQSDANAVIRIASRKRELANLAAARGVAVIRDANGLIKKIGPQIPTGTTLAKTYLQAETHYRAFSAMTHGQGVVVLRAAFAPVAGQKGAFEEHLSADTAANLITRSVIWFARASWAYLSFHGWAGPPVVTLLEESFNKMLIDDRERFWRSGI